mgnify:CR=1 FL=1
MVILVDTNIIIDALANREPYADDAKRIMEKCAAREITGILAAHSIPNLFYILRKNFSQEERRFLLKNKRNCVHPVQRKDMDNRPVLHW